MSTQNKYDLVLLGNAIVDNIYCLTDWANEGTSNSFSNYYNSIGGIGNIIQALKDSKLNMKIECSIGNDLNGQMVKQYFDQLLIDNYLHASKNSTSQALILANVKSNERTSFVNWGCGNDPIVTSNLSRWTHISYLDIIYKINVEALRTHSDVISADLCLSSPTKEVVEAVHYQLQFIDYLFASESELSAIIKNSPEELITEHNLSCLVYHKRDRTFIFDKQGCQEIMGTHKLEAQAQVLGAGDAYCANFILSKLNGSTSNEEAALQAHKQATKFILER